MGGAVSLCDQCGEACRRSGVPGAVQLCIACFKTQGDELRRPGRAKPGPPWGTLTDGGARGGVTNRNVSGAREGWGGR
jgi:hypothetical protein